MGKKETIYNALRTKVDWISPAIIYENSIYKIWYIYNKVVCTESKNLKNFTDPRLLDIKFKNNTFAWHLDVIHNGDKYETIIVAYKNWEKRALMNLYYTKSYDNINYDVAKVILKPSMRTNNWDNSGLYRSSLLYVDGTYYVFYSGQGTDNSKGMGLMYGKDIFNLKSYY